MKKKIVVIEDDLAIQDVFKIALEFIDYEVVVSSDGQRTLDDG